MEIDVIVPKLESAKSAIAKAEADLERAMSQVRVAPRWEKVGISAVLEVALAELREAKAELARIEAAIATDKAQA